MREMKDSGIKWIGSIPAKQHRLTESVCFTKYAVGHICVDVFIHIAFKHNDSVNNSISVIIVKITFRRE